MAQGSLSSITRKLAPTTSGAIYAWVGLIVIFSVLQPHTFANTGTAKLVLNEYAITGLVALGLILPLSAGLYDLSVGSVVGLSGITSAWVLANVSANIWLAISLGLLVALAVGLVNSFVIIVMGVDSFIGTLATSSIIGALAIAISGDNNITENVTGQFQNLALKNLDGVTTPVFLMFIAMLILGYVMERTVFGRHTYAIGFDREVARLGGVRINQTTLVTLLVSALLAGLAGVAETATLGAGSDTVGPSYLLPAFAAAFLGATQFRHGRFNPWGTVVAVLLIGTGEVGLLIDGAPAWAPDIFDGVILIVAVSLTSAKGIGPLRNIWKRKPWQMNSQSRSRMRETISP